MDSERSSLRIILMFPWLAHGHIFPFLELGKRIILKKKNDVHILFCTTAVNFSSIESFIRRNSFLQKSIELVELHLQPDPQLPPIYHTTKNLPPNLNLALVKAFQTAESSFSDIITNVKPDLVIFDVFQPWAAKLASSQGIPAVNFVVVGAATRSFIYHHYVDCCDDDDFAFPELCLENHGKKSMDDLMGFLFTNVFEHDKDLFFVNFRLSSEFVLVKTSRGLEGKYIDYVNSKSNKDILPVGPLVTINVDTNDEEKLEILQWLSKKNRNSTLYISFGSECFLSKKEIEEIAKGLELCDVLVNFIWVIRFPNFMEKKTISVEEVLPWGFLERVKDRGIVMSGWAPQADILGHPSTGAFVSHCGWSSLNESLYYGVPVIAMPMKFNMFIDAKMLVAVGACVEVQRMENQVFKGEDIAKAINEVIVEKNGEGLKAINKVIVEKNGEGLRCRARELSEKMRTEEVQAINETVEHLWRLCCKNERKRD